MSGDHVKTPNGLRKLAEWYRELAANPVIWEARLNMAEDLDAEADLLEQSTHSEVCKFRIGELS